jgi:hypothetical protein
VLERVIANANQSVEKPTRGIVNILKKSGDRKSSFSYEIISNPIHGGAVPTGADNKANWDTYEPVLQYLLARLK